MSEKEQRRAWWNSKQQTASKRAAAMRLLGDSFGVQASSPQVSTLSCPDSQPTSFVGASSLPPKPEPSSQMLRNALLDQTRAELVEAQEELAQAERRHQAEIEALKDQMGTKASIGAADTEERLRKALGVCDAQAAALKTLQQEYDELEELHDRREADAANISFSGLQGLKDAVQSEREDAESAHRKLASCERKLQAARSQLAAAGVSPWGKKSNQEAVPSHTIKLVEIPPENSRSEDSEQHELKLKRLQRRLEAEHQEALSLKDAELVMLMDRLARCDVRAAQKVAAKDKEIESLKHQLEAGESLAAELVSLQERLELRESEAGDLVAMLAAKDAELSAVSKQLPGQGCQDRDEELEELREQLQTREAEGADLVGLLSSKDAELVVLRGRAEECQAETEETSELLASKHEELVALQQQLQPPASEELAAKDAELAAKDAALETLRVQLQALSPNKGALVEKDAELAAKDAALADLQEQLQALTPDESALAAKDAELAAKDAALADLQEQLQALTPDESALVEKDAELAAKDAELADLQEQLQAMECASGDKEAVLSAELAKVRSKVAAHEQEASVMATVLEAKEGEICQLRDQLADASLIETMRDTELTHARAQIAKCEAQATDQQLELALLKEEVAMKSPSPQKARGADAAYEAELSRLRSMLAAKDAAKDLELTKLREELAAWESAVDEIEAKDAELASIRAELESARGSVAGGADGSLEELKLEVQQLRAQLADQQKQAQETASALAQAGADLGAAQREAESKVNAVLTEAAQALHDALADQAAQYEQSALGEQAQQEGNPLTEASQKLAPVESEVKGNSASTCESPGLARGVEEQLRAELQDKEKAIGELQAQLEAVWKDAARALHDEVKQAQLAHKQEIDELQAQAEKKLEEEREDSDRRYDEVFEAAEKDVADAIAEAEEKSAKRITELETLVADLQKKLSEEEVSECALDPLTVENLQ